MPGTVTVFITTARSGTQWLARALAGTYPDLARVEHEPIGYAYQPRTYLRAYDSLDELRALPAVGEHLASVERDLERRDYVEVGFPCFAAVPLFHAAFPGRVRVVQLVRHPVFTAASMVTHNWYKQTRHDDLEAHITLRPTDAGVHQNSYAARWDEMSDYERCLFYWTEVHHFADEMRARHPSVPFLRIRFEDLFGAPQSTLGELVRFLELPPRPELFDWTGKKVDAYRYKSRERVRWQRIRRHPLTLELAERFGYDVEEGGRWGFHWRYRAAPRFVDWTLRQARRVRRRLLARD